MIRLFLDFVLSKEGATSVEYAIMASAIAAVIVAVVFAIGIKTESMFNAVNMP